MATNPCEIDRSATLPLDSEQTLADAIISPSQVSIDGNAVRTHDLAALLDAIRAGASTGARGRANRGLIFSKLRTQGAIGSR